MGTEIVDQIGPGGLLIGDYDTKLSDAKKNELLTNALPGASVETHGGVRAVRYRDQVILKKQVTHLGRPWPAFKKRIQIPRTWINAHGEIADSGLTPRFVGIYHYGSVTIFVDFEPSTYLRRKANNSAAHVATNDLFQAQVHGQFSRTDHNGNRLTSVRADRFAAYLQDGLDLADSHVDVFRSFNEEFLSGVEVQSLDAVKEMHAVVWPDRFQNEWAGFYLEYRFSSFVEDKKLDALVEHRKEKRPGEFDYDLGFLSNGTVTYFGDLKASTTTSTGSQGNDLANLRRCVNQYGKFWYVIYEHTTELAKDHADEATTAWNQWRYSVGYRGRNEFDPLSYASRFKASVRFVKMMILEVNPANFHLVLGTFAQGRQPDGAARAPKVMIKKRNIDNFLIYSESIDETG